MLDEPKVSIVMAAFNVENLVGEAVESVINQTYQNFELLIVDDASTDRTYHVLEKFHDQRIKLHTNPFNKGPSSARNFALRQASGVYVTVLDADDRYAPDRLQTLIKKASTEKNCIVADDSVIFLDSDPDELNPTVFSQQNIEFDESGEIWLSMREYFLKGTPNIKIMFPLSWIKEKGIFYDEQIKFGEDLKFLIDLMNSGLSLKLINFRTYFYRFNPLSITRSSLKPWDQLSHVHAHASEIFLEQGDEVLAEITRNSATKYMIFDKIKKKDLRGLLRILVCRPHAAFLLFEGIKETLIFRLKEGRIAFWR